MLHTHQREAKVDLVSEPIDEHFSAAVRAMQPGQTGSELPLLELFDAQLGSRHLDLAARVLGGRGRGFYSIG